MMAMGLMWTAANGSALEALIAGIVKSILDGKGRQVVQDVKLDL